MITSEMNQLLVSISDEDSAMIGGGAQVKVDVGASAQGQQSANTFTDANTIAITIPSTNFTGVGGSSTQISFPGRSIAFGFGFAAGIAID